MRLLILTQVVDTNDPVLGFFHRWIEEIAQKVDHINVVCLREGEHNFPANVRVYSLGKERGGGRIKYALRFYVALWRLRGTYDAVFVHMNQEYVLLGGLVWRLFGKKMYMWRNHYAGTFLTDIAAALCTKVFCTSKHSYTAKYRRTVLMPVGIDTTRFVLESQVLHQPDSVLFLARMAESKRPHMLLDALAILKTEEVHFSATFVGSPTPDNEVFYKNLITRAEELGLEKAVRFLPGRPNHEIPELYRSSSIFVNASPSGMFDKTIFEAAACGCIVLASSEDFKDAAGEEYYFDSSTMLADRIRKVLAESSEQQERMRVYMQSLARGESLATLADRLVAEWSY